MLFRSAGGTPAGQPESSSCPSHQSEELVRSLIDQLDEKTREAQDLKTKLQELQTELQSAGDRENFVIAELAAQVHDINCKQPLCSSAFVFCV